jgi:hypothetical protein
MPKTKPKYRGPKLCPACRSCREGCLETAFCIACRAEGKSKFDARTETTQLVAISLLNLQIGDFMDTQKAISVLKNLTDVFAGSYVCDALRMSIKSLETKELAQQTTNSDYAALAQKWRDAAKSTNVNISESSVFICCASDLDKLNSAKAPNCA